MAYAVFFSFILFASDFISFYFSFCQWLAYADFVNFIFLQVGGLPVASGWLRSLLVCVPFFLLFGVCFPILILSNYAALGLKRA